MVTAAELGGVCVVGELVGASAGVVSLDAIVVSGTPADSSALPKGAANSESATTAPKPTPIRPLVERSFHKIPVTFESAFPDLFTGGGVRSSIYQRVNPTCMKVNPSAVLPRNGL